MWLSGLTRQHYCWNTLVRIQTSDKNLGREALDNPLLIDIAIPVTVGPM